MATKAERIEAIRRWHDHCDNIQRMTIVPVESEADKLRRIERARKDYAFFVSYYFPHYCTDKKTGKTIPSAKFHIEAAKLIRKNNDKNLWD